MDTKNRVRYSIGFIILLILLVSLLIVNIYVGEVKLSMPEIGRILLNYEDPSAKGHHIIWDIRLPRILAAVILGGALSVAGFLLQTFFSNPIAGPFVLGISSGAKMVVAMVMIFVAHGAQISSAGMILAAFLGSILSMAFILIISQRVKSKSILIICGVMIGYICSAATDFVINFADESNIVKLHNWALGSFSSVSWEQVQVMSLMVFLSMIWAFLLSKPMGAYQLGETYARNMGVNIRQLRFMLILLSSILAASVTAFAGPISFVGIAVPHLIKNLFRTSKPLIMIPAGFLGGAVFCLFCDLLARTLFAPTELSISSVTAVFGAPIVIWIMLHRDKKR